MVHSIESFSQTDKYAHTILAFVKIFDNAIIKFD